MRVTIVGLGGVGSRLAREVAQDLAFANGAHTLTLVDGDVYEERNGDRQEFDRLGNKAAVTAAALARRFPQLTVDAIPEFCAPENADLVLPEGEIVLLAVDNHATRKMVSDVAGQRREISVISGGNEDTWGTIQVYLRRDGRDITPSLSQDHPEIAHPTDRAPYELSCEERAAAGAPQLRAANLMATACMVNAFWRLTSDPEGFASKRRGSAAATIETAYTEVYFDCEMNRVMGRRHPVAADATAMNVAPTVEA